MTKKVQCVFCQKLPHGNSSHCKYTKSCKEQNNGSESNCLNTQWKPCKLSAENTYVVSSSVMYRNKCHQSLTKYEYWASKDPVHPLSIYVLLVSVFLVIYLILGSPRKIIWLPLSLLPRRGTLLLLLLIYL